MNEEKPATVEAASTVQDSQSPKDSTSTAYQPIDFSEFAISQNFGSQLKVTKRLTKVPVYKPKNTQWFRIHPNYKQDMWLLKYGDSSDDYYLVSGSLADQLADFVKPFKLVVGVDRQGVVFVWPLRLPDPERLNAWHLTAMEAAKNAELEWTRVQSNMSLGANELYSAEGITDEPKWPELSMNEIFDIAFKQKKIKRPDHFVLKQLLGET